MLMMIILLNHTELKGDFSSRSCYDLDFELETSHKNSITLFSLNFFFFPYINWRSSYLLHNNNLNSCLYLKQLLKY